jgi:hypothetical protein
MFHARRSTVLLSALLLVACGEGPEPVTSSASGAMQGTELPPNHPPMGGGGMGGGNAMPQPATFSDAVKLPGPAHFTGSVRLEGALDSATTGFFFVTARAAGQKSPWLSRKYGIDHVAVTRDANGARSLAFDLNAMESGITFVFGAPDVLPSANSEIHVRFSEAAFVESPTLAEQAVPIVEGQNEYELTLGY